MSSENEENTLGENITQIALGKKAKDTVVVSVRLSVEDFSRLEKICIQTDMSMSQVVREAVAAYSGPEGDVRVGFKMNMQTSEGLAFALGPVEYSVAPSASRITGCPAGNQVSGRIWEEPVPERKSRDSVESLI